MENSGSNNNPTNDLGQNSNSPSPSNSQTSVESGSQNVVKHIILEEEDLVKISGIYLIIFLMILTITFYYRDDIKELTSKTKS